jgi:hypothetical protein
MYVDALLEEEAKTPGVNVVSFRMKTTEVFIPDPSLNALIVNNVGISFAYHRVLFNEGFTMSDGGVEDYELIKRLESSATIRPDLPRVTVMSPLCTYFVRLPPVMDRDNMTLADILVPGANRVKLDPK